MDKGAEGVTIVDNFCSWNLYLAGGFDDSDLLDGKPLPPVITGSLCQYPLQRLPKLELVDFALVVICLYLKE